MNSDYAFSIGETHRICQDYALHGDNYIIVSDGCSGSVSSDIGSRILSITAKNHLKEIDDLHQFDENKCVLSSRPIVNFLNLQEECLDATLLVAAKYQEIVTAICFGDGTIAVKMKNGITFIIDTNYLDSYPFYLNYLHGRNNRYLDWKNNHNDRQILVSIIDKDNKLVSTKEHNESSFRLDFEGKEAGVVMVKEYSTFVDLIYHEDIEFISLMSDGIKSFCESKEVEGSLQKRDISRFEILQHLLSFKIYTGQFVQRRMNKFLKLCQSNGWKNLDDISLAVIYFGK